MGMSNGEKYTVFLLLTTQSGHTRRVLEGLSSPDGIAAPAGPAANAAALTARASTALQALGVPAANLGAPANLALLFDNVGPNSNNVTTDQAKIAAALPMPYSGDCPGNAVEGAILIGIKNQLG
jgi:hypothetical protein